ncbi:Hypothetical_protein [Hexamita inflata]|uniref:Hypothetical_protein n=1 Tax=Hexamita inflata TaxID=28002 RepID=A0ABP1IK29_9EUKA
MMKDNKYYNKYYFKITTHLTKCMHFDTVTNIPQYSQWCIQTLPILHMIFVIPVTISKRSSIETCFKVELPGGGASSQCDPEQAEKSVIHRQLSQIKILEPT